jgi:glutathionylspermidine synthase
MSAPVKLIPIPKDKYPGFRRQVIFSCSKWDPQVGDVNTIADQVAVISAETGKQLCQWAEQLAAETLELEMELTKRPDLYQVLGLPRPVQKALIAGQYNPDQNIRLMRFDFHPTKEGRAVSEVNSDVPGGFGEASRLNRLAASLFPSYLTYGDVGAAITTGFSSMLPEHARVAFVHATSYSDDRQVMHFLSEAFQKAGFKCLMIAPDHLR